MDIWNGFRALIAKVFAAHQLIFAAPQEPSTRWLTREEIEERETQATLRELEKLQNRRDFLR